MRSSACKSCLCRADKPDPPYDVTMKVCGSGFAEITWEPGNENNDEVISFHVFYNTSFDSPGEYHEGAEVLRGTHTAKVGGATRRVT